MVKQTLRQDLQQIANFIPEGSKVLELGCGTGELLDYLNRVKHVDGHGIELEQSNVSACVQNGLSVIQGNVETDLAYYPDKCFDYIISSQVLQATHRPRDTLKEMLRVARHCIVSIPNFGHWKNRAYLAFNGAMPVTRALSYQWYETPNIHFCTLKDFDALCRDIGCTTETRLFLDQAGNTLALPLQLIASNAFSYQGIYLLTK